VEAHVTLSLLLLHLAGAEEHRRHYSLPRADQHSAPCSTFREAFWEEVSNTFDHLMHFIPVSISRLGGRAPHQECGLKPTARDRPGAPDLPRITNGHSPCDRG